MKRTIAAILAADVAGYSRLMAEDEEDTLVRLAAVKAVFLEAVARSGGRIFNTAGDAILAEFPSGVEALRAAVAIQRALAEGDRDTDPQRRVRFRMGLTIGDVVEVEGDLLGDGVNVASRLEGIAEPGGICVSRTLHEAVSGKVRVTFRDIGAQKLKNLPRPVHAFRVVMPDDLAGAVLDPGRALGRTRRLAVAALLLIPMAAGGLWFAWRPAAEDPEGHAATDAVREPLTASVVRAARACFSDEIHLAGRLAPRHEIAVRPETEGLEIARILAEPFASVQSGQSLAELRPSGGQDPRPVTVHSPVDGLLMQVGAGSASVGTPLALIAADAAFELRAEAPLPVLARLAPGQEATVTPLGGQPHLGRVRLVGADLDPATQLGQVHVALDSVDGRAPPVRSGQFGAALVHVGERCGIAAPAASIMHTAQGQLVYVAKPGGVEVRPVVTGLLVGRSVEIKQGLDERDLIVARAGAFLREGDSIRPIIVE